MRHATFAGLAALMLCTGCAITSLPRTETVRGYEFTTQAIEIDNVNRDDFFYYVITYPDGTVSETRRETDRYSAAREKDRLLARWVTRRRAPGTSPVVAGPPASAVDLPQGMTTTEPEPLSPASTFEGGD